jgi:hypothetical protein
MRKRAPAPRTNTVLVFVPGGMGSQLELGKDLVWNDGVVGWLDSLKMIRNPAMALPWVPLNAPACLSFYDSFISFLGECGYTKDIGNLLVWPYDWRISFEETGNRLNSEINRKLSEEFRGKKIVFICHSLGCMVVRWALLYSKPDIRSSVERVIAAAPPGLGIPAVFREMLELTIGSTWLQSKALAAIKAISRYNIDIPIIRVARAVTSLLDLLPPDSMPILTTGDGGQIGTFAWKGWPDELSELRKSVLARRARRASSWKPISRTLIASNQHSTESAYVLKRGDDAIAFKRWDKGDESVTYISARAYMDLTPADQVKLPDTEVLVASPHGGLLDDSAARTAIANLIHE